LPGLRICGRYPSAIIAVPVKQGFPYHWQFSKANCIMLSIVCRQQAEAIQNKGNANVRNMGDEPPHRKYKRLKLGGGQAYDRSNV
jgi:hypothetical protein